MMVVDLSLDKAVDNGALADPAVPQEDHLHLLLREAAGVEFGRVHTLVLIMPNNMSNR